MGAAQVVKSGCKRRDEHPWADGDGRSARHRASPTALARRSDSRISLSRIDCIWSMHNNHAFAARFNWLVKNTQ